MPLTVCLTSTSLSRPAAKLESGTSDVISLMNLFVVTSKVTSLRGST